jgi:hypothetical protein
MFLFAVGSHFSNFELLTSPDPSRVDLQRIDGRIESKCNGYGSNDLKMFLRAASLLLLPRHANKTSKSCISRQFFTKVKEGRLYAQSAADGFQTLQKDQILRAFNTDYTLSILENTIAVQQVLLVDCGIQLRLTTFQAKENHNITTKNATEILGKFLTASSLLASSLKGEERLIIDAAFPDYQVRVPPFS